MARKRKVLIVDDEQDVITYLSTALRHDGHTAYSAEDVRSALEELAKTDFDLICLDIMMPKQSGISLYTKIRMDDRFKHIPVLIISAFVQEEEYDFRRFVSDRTIPVPEGFLEKPIKPDHFLRTVNQLLGSGSVC
jgi:CheY-like chemotaxis protein